MSIDKAWLRRLKWRKARQSIGNGACVEVAQAKGGVAVRDSKHPDSAVLCYPSAYWQAFVEGTKKGDFDLSSLSYGTLGVSGARSARRRLNLQTMQPDAGMP